MTRHANNPEEEILLSKLIDSYEKLPFKVDRPIRRFIRDLLNDAMSRCDDFLSSIFENSHTISDSPDVRFRGAQMSAFRREHVPLVPI